VVHCVCVILFWRWGLQIGNNVMRDLEGVYLSVGILCMNKKKQNKSIFDNDIFRNAYPVTKTLRFELLGPGVWDERQRKMIFDREENEGLFAEKREEFRDGLLKNDRERFNDVKKVKHLLNILHEDFINRCLRTLRIYDDDLGRLYKKWCEYRKQKGRKGPEQGDADDGLQKARNALGEEKGRIRKIVVKEFEKERRFYKNGYTELLKEGVLSILKSRSDLIKKEEKGSVENMEGFFGGISDFTKNRENYYSSDEKSTAVAHRIIDRNLVDIFFPNVERFEEDEDRYKELLTKQELKVFELKNYNKYFLQEGIEEYNNLLGGSSSGGKGINQKVKEYNDGLKEKKNKEESSGDKKEEKLSTFKQLQKQIGSTQNKQESTDRSPIEGDDDLVGRVKDFLKIKDRYIKESEKIASLIFSKVKDEDESLLFSKTKAIALAKELFGDKNYWFLRAAFSDADVISIVELKRRIEERPEKDTLSVLGNKDVLSFFMTLKKKYDNLIQKEKKQKEKLEKNMKMLEECLRRKKQIPKDKRVAIVNSVQEYFDTINAIDRLIRLFSVPQEKIDREVQDGEFYGNLEDFLNFKPSEELDILRNYLTKNYLSDADKIRLFFDRGDLLKRQSSSNAGYFRDKEGDVFVGVFEKGVTVERYEEDNKRFKSKDFISGEYSYFSVKQLPRKTLDASFKNDFQVKYVEMKGRNEMKAVRSLQQHIKGSYLKKYPSFKGVVEKTYSDEKEFSEDLDKALKDILRFEFLPLHNDFGRDGKVHLFKIHSSGLKKQKNLHSIYFNAVFSEDNLNNPYIKQSANGMIFFRDPIDESLRQFGTVKNSRGEDVKDKEGRKIKEHKRYREEKIFLHFPIEINTKAENRNGVSFAMNTMNGFLKENNKNIGVIGIDRGERNLLYYYLLNREGVMIDCGKMNGSLPNCSNKTYLDLLEERERERTQARQRWSSEVPDIKNLKKGYLSQVVPEVIKLALDNNAVIVLEGLMPAFIEGRRKVEKNIYSQFQKALIEKLNFYVKKQGKETDMRNALQLTPTVQSLEGIRNGAGILFFVLPSYTSTTCPNCGWRWRQEDRYTYRSVDRSVKEFEKIKITYEKNKKRFKFEYRESRYPVYSNVSRIFDKRSADDELGEVVEDFTPRLEKIFRDADVVIEKDINGQIKEFRGRQYKTFWYDLVKNLHGIFKIRSHSKTEDFILCPSCHFDSRENDGRIENGNKVPNGDANGAYNIAKRGLMYLDIIKKTKEEKDGRVKPNLSINLKSWDEYTSGNSS